MTEPLRFSRWKRLPGLRRIHEHRVPNHLEERQRLSLYLPGALLEQVQQLALRRGIPSVQHYCEALLTRAIAAEFASSQVAPAEAVAGALSELDEIFDDATTPAVRLEPIDDHPQPEAEPFMTLTASPESRDPLARLLHHAALDRDPDAQGFLGWLRRGQPVPVEALRELIEALAALETQLEGQRHIDRRLAYTLHRLSLESQVLISDAWPALGADRALVEGIYLVQQAVDRVLCGLDVADASIASDAQAEPPP